MRPGRLVLYTQDNNGRRGNIGLWMPSDMAPALVLAYANQLRGPLLGLSQNQLIGAEYTVKVVEWGPGPAEAGANSRRSAVLIYSSAPPYARLVIPSPRPELAETSGPMAGFRITRESATAAGLLDELEQLVTGTVTENGDPWPVDFNIGSIDEIT